MNRKLFQLLANSDLKTVAYYVAKETQGTILKTEKANALNLFLRLPCPETASVLVSVWPEMIAFITESSDYLIRTIPENGRGSKLQDLEKWMESFDFNLKAAERIQKFLLKEAQENRVEIGFHRMREQSNLYLRLNCIGIKKGLFANRRQFLRNIITSNQSAFRVVNDLICINGIHKGQDRFWNGLGAESDPQLNLQSDIQYEISESVDSFIALLDELNRIDHTIKYKEGER